MVSSLKGCLHGVLKARETYPSNGENVPRFSALHSHISVSLFLFLYLCHKFQFTFTLCFITTKSPNKAFYTLKIIKSIYIFIEV